MSAADAEMVSWLMQERLLECLSPVEIERLKPPSASDYPTSRFMLVMTSGAVIGVVGAVLPGAEARYGFEEKLGFPHPEIPAVERTRLGEGLMLYVLPRFRRGGVARALSFLTMLLNWEAGAECIASEVGGVSLEMAVAAGFADTGLVTMSAGGVPFHLTVGSPEVGLRQTWSADPQLFSDIDLDAELQSMVERWFAWEKVRQHRQPRLPAGDKK